jgi:hypothetical protein
MAQHEVVNHGRRNVRFKKHWNELAKQRLAEAADCSKSVESQDLIDAILGQLTTDDERELFMLRFIDGLPHAEIAARLAIQPVQVARRLVHLLKKAMPVVGAAFPEKLALLRSQSATIPTGRVCYTRRRGGVCTYAIADARKNGIDAGEQEAFETVWHPFQPTSAEAKVLRQWVAEGKGQDWASAPMVNVDQLE